MGILPLYLINVKLYGAMTVILKNKMNYGHAMYTMVDTYSSKIYSDVSNMPAIIVHSANNIQNIL